MPKLNTVYDIGAAFEAIENELISSMIRNMRRHKLEEIDEDKQWTMWQALQLKSLEKYKKDNQKKHGKQFKDINAQIKTLITMSRSEGEMAQEIAVLMTLVILTCFCATGCTEADQVSANISQEADNFNVTRKLTVLNARTDTILLELTGTFALKNNSSRELEVIIETAEGKYQKDYVYLNDYTMYVVEDISGSDVDKYHYEINFLPQWGLKVTHND